MSIQPQLCRIHNRQLSIGPFLPLSVNTSFPCYLLPLCQNQSLIARNHSHENVFKLQAQFLANKMYFLFKTLHTRTNLVPRVFAPLTSGQKPTQSSPELELRAEQAELSFPELSLSDRWSTRTKTLGTRSRENSF